MLTVLSLAAQMNTEHYLESQPQRRQESSGFIDLGCFQTCRSFALFRNRDSFVTLLHSLLGSVRFHTATLQSVPNCV